MADDNVGKDFQRLFSRSQELFDGMRDMPRFGIKHWQMHFMKTFEAFTKLWKFQQENRAVLEETVNLQRHQIGDIASKIGQLYYHYYLHTGDVKYLLEAMEFYSAVHNRSYFKQQVQNIDIAVKHLRYLARYYVVALILKDNELMDEIIQSLQSQVESLSSDDVALKVDWSNVLKEAKIFSQVDHIVTVTDESGRVVCLNQRHEVNKFKDNHKSTTTDSCLKLRNAIIIGGCEKQVKFSELTIDMYRALQLIEYQINSDNLSKSPENKEDLQYQNPLKHLLYKPSFSQIYAFLSAIFKELTFNSVLLLYISGDSDNTEYVGSKHMYAGGVATTASDNMGPVLKNLPKNISNPYCLYPDDITPFTRKPLFLIVDSTNSLSYQSIPNVFNQPLVCLMSPSELPVALQSKKHGSLFTLFLLDSLLAICKLCNITKLSDKVWMKSKQLVRKVSSLGIEMLLHHATDETAVFAKFLEDDFLRNIISNYLICWMVLRLYKKSKGPSCLPSCTPPIPKEVVEHKTLHRHLLEVAAQMGTRDMFYDISELPPTYLT